MENAACLSQKVLSLRATVLLFFFCASGNFNNSCTMSGTNVINKFSVPNIVIKLLIN